MLRALNLPAMMDTSSNNLTTDFFAPLLSNSVSYDRGVGYFSSAWLRINSLGMTNFANNGGRARWVTSPILSAPDWEALIAGNTARNDPILYSALEKNITSLAETLEKDTLSALAWMIADGIITFKLALPREKLDNGDFHDKFGIFTDLKGYSISFNGSYNDSAQGLRNYESIKIFCSWHPAFTNLVEADQQRFEKLWNNLDPNVRVFDLPEAARERILCLRTEARPYMEPEWVKIHRVQEAKNIYIVNPTTPDYIILRDYQEEAIRAWFSSGCKGFLEMATGTGKTITALAASAQLFEREKQLAVVITVPYQHLVDQWNKDTKTFGYLPVLAYKNKGTWLDELKQQIREYNAGYRRSLSVITTHKTFTTKSFQDCITSITAPSVLIADEAHHLGAEQSRLSYPENISFRLALSATPDRWFDDLGTSILKNYFGETVFALPLDKAIGLSLTPYYYYPHLVPLTHEELDAYQEISFKVARLIHKDTNEGQQALKNLLIQRSELLNNAKNKISVLSQLINEPNLIQHTLFYCSPGQIDTVMQLLAWEKRLRIHRFTAEENIRKRQQILQKFADGSLQALVAMKCLDEGVDIPSTHAAFFLASSSNPREFIQRRGRVLRQAKGKSFSTIHDLIAIPPPTWIIPRDSPTFTSERNILRKELQRFKEFADLALNKHQALDVIWPLLERYGLKNL